MSVAMPPRLPLRAALQRSLGSMTRATRDTLFLLAVLAWTLAPHVGHIPPWCSAMTLAALAWRARVALRGSDLPSRWWLFAALLLGSALAWANHSTLSTKDAGVTLLVLLAGLKTLELRARRDALVVFFLGFFVVLTNFLYSQSFAVALAMLVAVLGLLTALLLAHLPDVSGPGHAAATTPLSTPLNAPLSAAAPTNVLPSPATRAPSGQAPGLRRAAALALWQVLIGAPLVLLLFVLFPRLPPLWGVASEGMGRTGLSDRMALGQVAELAGDDTLAMRVRFLGPQPAPETLYFRGPVLSRYDGHSWRSLPDFGIDKLRLVQGATLAYEMTVEPLRVASLPLLETTLEPPQVEGAAMRLTLRDDLHWQPDRLIIDRLRVRARASLGARHAPGSLPLLREEQLALPKGAHPRTIAWAQAWRQSLGLSASNATQRSPHDASTGQPAPTDQLAQALLAHIRAQDYKYTLTPGPERPGDDALDAFWLDRRAGFCEHYAAAFVVIMRSLGVPARIVTGYLGGQLNPIDGLLDIRQSDAHAWAEYWRPGHGWVRADPTGAVAPERILQGQRAAPQLGLIGRSLSTMSPALVVQWQSLRDVWTALDQHWNEAVLNYSSERQRDLLQRLGFEGVDAMLLIRLLGGLLAGLGLAGAGWAAWRQRQQRQGDPWLREWRALQHQLQRLGWPVAPHLSPRGVASLIAPQPPGTAVHVAALVQALDAFERSRYGAGSQVHRRGKHLQRAVLHAAQALRSACARPPG